MSVGLTDEQQLADSAGDRPATVPSRSPYLWMLCGSVSFAFMGTLAHGLGSTCDWQVIAFFRSFLAFLFAAGLTAAAGARFAVRRPRILWIRSLAGSLSLVCTFYALAEMPQSDVLTITNIFPLWVALICWPLYGQRPAASLVLALISGLVGVVLIQQPHFRQGNLGAVTALAASLATAIAMLGLNRLHALDPRAIVVHFSGVAALLCIACLFLFPRRQAALSLPVGRDLLMLLGVGVTATIGQLFLTKAFAAGPPTRVSLVGLTQIPLALLLDVAVWGHTVNGLTVVGMALVLGPTAWVMASRGDGPPLDQG